MFPVWTTEQVVTFFAENEVMLRHKRDEATSGHAESTVAVRLPVGMSRRQRELRQRCGVTGKSRHSLNTCCNCLIDGSHL